MTAPPDTSKPVAPIAVVALEELVLTTEGDATVLTHTINDGPTQGIVLGVCTMAFILYIIVFVPFLNAGPLGSALWIVLGLLILAGVGFLVQSSSNTTRLRIAPPALQIDQGSAIDREHIAIAWREIVAVELEPVDVKKGDRGMKLRVLLREGEPVDVLPGLAIGDLNEARQRIMAQVHLVRANPPAPAGDAGG